MIPELGNLALVLALCLAVVQGILPLAGAWQHDAGWVALARPAAAGQCLFVSLAFAALSASCILNDFSVSYVAAHSHAALPMHLRVAATWGGQAGSLLLWTWMLALGTVAAAVLSRQLPDHAIARMLAVLAWISIGFLCFILFTSNPFERTLPALADGRDLHPLLQDTGMSLHPPLPYMGYVGFSVAFAFALAALMSGQLDSVWARWSRPWTLAAWMFLTLGIFLGSFWAYDEFGWGGWFRDAGGNASFMPWLAGSALMHSLAVTQKRGSCKNRSVLLVALTCALSLLGAFLLRSGVLSSVHAFAADPRRGLLILIFLALLIGAALLLYAWRASTLGAFSLFSRESVLLVNNVLLLVAAATVLLGTLYPLVFDALNLGKISSGPPYFEAVFVPLMLPVLLSIGAGPFISWKDACLKQVSMHLGPLAIGTLVFAAAAALILQPSPLMVLGLSLALWILLTTGSHLARRLTHGAAGASARNRLRSQPGSYWGMLVAHAGIGIFVAGVTLVKGRESVHDVSLRVGDSAHAGAYRFTFSELKKVDGPDYVAARARFDVWRGAALVATMQPEKRLYPVQQMPMTEAAIERAFSRDLYVSLGEATPDGAWLVRVQHKPFMSWVWAGCLAMAVGGLLAACDRRYRIRVRKQVRARLQPAGAAAAAAPIVSA